MKIRDVLLLAGLVTAFAPSLAAQTGTPRPSATDTSYLSCTTWSGHGWTEPKARSARTQVLVSPEGLRAYGEVEVKVLLKEDCENRTTLHVASGVGQAYKVAYVQSVRNGNGIRLIGWSPSGKKLLTEVNLWDYESDSGYDHVAVVYDATKNSAKEISELDQEVSRHFGSNCEFEIAVIGWKTDEQILVGVSRPPSDESYEQRFCVKQSQTFMFDLSRNTFQGKAVGSR